MKKLLLHIMLVTAAAVMLLSIPVQGAELGALSESLKDSLVYLELSGYAYDQARPWRHQEVSSGSGYACAVGEYEVLTSAYNMKNSAYIRARRYGQNEYIPAKVKVIDYECNLCLLELDRQAMTAPLRPVAFGPDFRQGAEIEFYWLAEEGRIYNGRGYIDHARVEDSVTSYAQFLLFVITNASRPTGLAEVFFLDGQPIGLGCWYKSGSDESGVIPGEIINTFLDGARGEKYAGFAAAGFDADELLDPTMRNYLKMPAEMKSGVYVKEVYTVGSGCETLKAQDVILAVNGVGIDARGQIQHERYGQIGFHHLLTSLTAGQPVSFTVWREGQQMQAEAESKAIPAGAMLVPYYEYDRQPEYIVVGGYILQRLTREYMKVWGEGWSGKVSAHLYHYYQDLAFLPTEQRREVIVLSYVLPADINQGYKDLRQMVVSKFDGKEVSRLQDIAEALQAGAMLRFHTIEFELNNPLVVIPTNELAEADALISKRYGVDPLMHIE